jgi:DNA-binding NtrC family response regulator
MPEKIHVLMIERSKYSADLNARELTRGGYEVVWRRVESEEAMREALREESYDVILSDHSPPVFDSFAALAVKNEFAAGAPFIIVSEDVAPEVIRTSMQNGCCAYLVRKNLHQLAILVKKILASRRAAETTDGAASEKERYGVYE